MKYVTIIDGTTGSAARQAQALGNFIREGLHGPSSGETLIFHADDREKARLVKLAPTRRVRLVKTALRHPDHMAEILTALTNDEAVSLLLTAAGPGMVELATRVACRSEGSLLTDALSAEPESNRLLCRRNVYSNHLQGLFALSARPWCLSLDDSWMDAPTPAPIEHEIVSDEDHTPPLATDPCEDLELVASQSTAGLAKSAFVVVAGSGAGGKDGVTRIAAAARRMGADLGVSRPVAMSAWAPLDRLVGVSGVRTAPKVCIVVGASGAPAFYWGIENARFIVAIDLDEHAPIVSKADVAVVDDGVTIIEALAEIVCAQRTDDSSGTGERPGTPTPRPK